jgi:hypothetical protein
VTNDGFETEDIDVLKTYQNKTEYTEYGAIDLSAYANRYSVYWYRYNQGYRLNYISILSEVEWNENKTEHESYSEYVNYCEKNNKEYRFANFLGNDWERVLIDSNENRL